MDDNVYAYNIGLVDKSCKQRQEVDFDKIFSLITMPKSIRIMQTIVAYHDYKIWQIDIKIAFQYIYIYIYIT